MRVVGIVLMLLFSGAAFAAGKSVQQLELSVPGMNCPVCPITVRKALEKVPGVRSASVDYDTKVARIEANPAKVSVQALKEATANVGYPSELVTR